MYEVIRRLLGWAIPVAAVVVMIVGLWPDGEALDPADRVQSVAAGIRCPFCSGESLAGSTSQVARDLRVIIAEQVEQGMTNAEIENYFVARYGEQILLDPSWSGRGLALWLAPLAVAAAGVAAIVGMRRRRRGT